MAEGLSVNSLCSSDNGTWTRPGGHGGKKSFSCRWPDGCTSRKTSGSFPRWLYLPSLAAFQTSVTFGESHGGRGCPCSAPRAPHSVSWSVVTEHTASTLEPLTGGLKPSPVSQSLSLRTRLVPVAPGSHTGFSLAGHWAQLPRVQVQSIQSLYIWAEIGWAGDQGRERASG